MKILHQNSTHAEPIAYVNIRTHDINFVLPQKKDKFLISLKYDMHRNKYKKYNRQHSIATLITRHINSYKAKPTLIFCN